MLQDNEEKLDNNEVSFVPDESNNTTESGDALFVPDKKQPNLLSVDINEIEKSQNAGGFMKFLTDAITADVQIQNKMDITKGELISGGVEGVAEATLTQPADIAASTLQVVGDLTDSKGISEFGKEMSNTVKSFNEFIEKDWITKDESIDPKIKQIARVMGAGGGQVLQMQGMAKSLGGAFTYALYTVPDASDVYLGYRKEGYGKTEAGTAGIATGAGFYAIDRFFDGAKLMKGMKNTSLGLLDVLLEPTAEMSQEAYKNMVFKIGPDKTRDLMSGVIESGIGGLAGGMVGSASVSINGVEYNPNTNYETARQAALDAGATEEDVNNLMAEMYTNIDSNPEKVSKYLTDLANKNAEQITSMIREMPKSVAYQSVNDFYKTVDEFITANEGTPEAERAKQTKAELDNVYKDTYSALENLMPKQEADANARLVQGHALFASQEFGVSPKTYMDTMFAKVEQGGEDFLGETAQMQEQLDVAQRINEIDAEEQANGVPEYTAPTININGVERQTTNSDGAPIAKSEKSLRYFYDWFGDSKVVDEQGRPLVVYHGTGADFSVFDKTKADSSVGLPAFYFSSSEQYSREYGSITMPVYLKAENVFNIGKYVPDGWYELKTNEERVDLLKKQGYDGVFDYNAGATEYAVFNPNQIKSTSNRGTFSRSDNIHYQEGQINPIVEFNAVTFEDPENQEAVRKAFEKNGFSKKAANDAIANLQRVVDFAKSVAEESPRLKEQNERGQYVEQRPTEDVSKYEPEEMSLAVESGKKTLGLVPRVSVFVKNGEYQYNIDFGTTCTRREPLEAAVKIMIDMGKANNLGLSQINNIKDILGKHGFTKPCVLCFVEGKRTYELISANRLSRQWNVVLRSLGVDDAKVIGTERPLSDNVVTRLKELADGKGYEKYVDSKYRDKNEKDPVGLTKSRASTIAKIMLSEYERTGKSTLVNRMRPDMLMNSRGTDYLFRKYVNDAPTLKGLIAARDGAGTPKPHTSYPVYDTKSWKEIFDLKKDTNKEVKHLFDIGGVRLQSFSDFNEYMVVDYLQAMLDLSARGLPAHAYTKVTSFVELFGEMMNINMSLIGNTTRGISTEYDGLKPAQKGDRVVFEDKNGKWTYSWATESFDPKKAFELRKESRYKGKVGTVGIGISDNQILAMLNDPEIDMVIPFHKSGIQDHVLISAGFKRADGTSVKDYSDVQNTKKPKKADDYLFNEHMQELKDAKKVAKDYLEWCKKNKYTPKFEQFSKHENYYKLLEDFRSYDNNGKPVVQKAVEFKIADDFNENLRDAVKNRDEVVEAISKIQSNEALMSDLEEAVRYAHLDGEVKKVMLGKLQKAVGGKDNLKVLSQEDFLDELAKTNPKEAQQFRDGKGVLYGFAKGGKIYLNVQGFNANTPAHEYSHLWARVVQKVNPKLWARGVELLEQTDKWKELASDKQYSEIIKDKNMYASEVLARIVGEMNEDIAKYFQDPDAPEYKGASLKNKILKFIKDVYGCVRSIFDPKNDGSDIKTAKDFATITLLDLYDESRSSEVAKQIKKIEQFNAEMMTGYVSMRNPLVGTQLDADAHYGEGERGNMAHGWGNYLLLSQSKNKERYYEKFNRIDVSIKGDKVGTEIPSEYIVDMEYLIESEFDASPDPMGDKELNIKWALNNVIRRKEDYIKQRSQELDEKEKALSKKGFIKNKSIREDIQYEIEHLRGLINSKEEALRFYKKITPDMIEVSGGTAEQHEFDIPDVEFLLDENKSLTEQPQHVKDALEELNKKEGKAKGFLDTLRTHNPDRKITGYDVYQKLAQWSPETEFVKEARWASKQLEQVGIRGIHYDGNIDGEGVVIFNKEDTKHIRRLLQGQAGQDPRGAYYNGIIHLFQNADPSTFVHESMHFYKEELMKMKDKSAKARSILETLENFASNEFAKNYIVLSKGGKYYVADKNGRVVYDNQGKLFETGDEAREYAKDEIVARGFEQFVREGKSPSKFLTRAFHSFMNWLKHIYKTAKDLGVELNDSVRQAYGDLLGGQDLDYWMGQPEEAIISEVQSVEQDRKKYLDDVINQAVKEKGTKVSEGKGRGFRDIWTRSMIPLSTRAKRVSPLLQTRLRRFEFSLANNLNKKYDLSRPFLDIWKNMSEEDAIAFDLALKNDYVEKQQEIVEKYNATEQWSKIKDVLADIYTDAIGVGLELGYRKDYFPRKVKDVAGFLSYMRGLEDWTRYQEALREADPENVFTPEEQAEFINKYMRGFVRVDLMPVKYGSEKQRKVPVVNNEINRFYAPSIDSYVSYIEGMNARIESAKFLGKDAENYDESIGGYLTYLQEQNLINPNQIDEVRDILRARFGQRGVSNRFLGTARDLSYIYTMGGINSAITQIEDLSVSMYKAGVWNTLTTMFSGKEITRKDIGVENISQEFVSQKKTSKWLNGLFKATGLDAIDGFGKETLINSIIKKYKQIYEKNPQALRDYLEPIMEDQTSSVINDILNGTKSDNLMYLVFSELSDVQPVSLSELPEFYNTAGNLRVLYMLKSFMVKRIDTFRNECFDKLKSKDTSVRIEGLQNLFRLSVLMIICGATKDWIIDLLYGRKTDMSETLVNNVLGMFGISKFHLYKAREQGFSGVLKEFVVPPLFSFWDDIIGDVFDVKEGKRKLKDLEVLKGIPLFGRFYYWWIGRGAEKQKKKRGKRRRR